MSVHFSDLSDDDQIAVEKEAMQIIRDRMGDDMRLRLEVEVEATQRELLRREIWKGWTEAGAAHLANDMADELRSAVKAAVLNVMRAIPKLADVYEEPEYQ